MLKRQRGFTLVELMISASLGVIVIGGMISLFSVNKETIRIQNNISLAQEKANFALEVIAADVRMAGWPGAYDPAGTDPFGSRNGTYPQFNDGGRFDTFVVSRRGRTADPTNPDPLLQQNEMDCAGDIIDFSTIATPLTHKYYVNPVTQQLLCESSITGKTSVLADNVIGFQVLYGVDARTGPCAYIRPNTSVKDAQAECMVPTVYVTGNQLATTLQTALNNYPAGASQLMPIKTVRLSIAIASEDDNIAKYGSGPAYFYLGANYFYNGYQGLNFYDGRIKRFSVKTIALKQAMRGP